MPTAPEIAGVWIEALRAQNGALAEDVLHEDATLDDFGGGHFAGKARLMRFADEIPAGLVIDAPINTVQEADGRRLTVFGRVVLPGLDDFFRVRWSFLIEDGQILSVVNSKVSWLYGVDDDPFDRRRAETWRFD